jgi:hypothetical protein
MAHFRISALSPSDKEFNKALNSGWLATAVLSQVSNGGGVVGILGRTHSNTIHEENGDQCALSELPPNKFIEWNGV